MITLILFLLQKFCLSRSAVQAKVDALTDEQAEASAEAKSVGDKNGF